MKSLALGSPEHAGLPPVPWNALAADVIITSVAPHPAVVLVFVALAHIAFPFSSGTCNAGLVVGFELVPAGTSSFAFIFFMIRVLGLWD
jgi:hypothetical protein